MECTLSSRMTSPQCGRRTEKMIASDREISKLISLQQDENGEKIWQLQLDAPNVGLDRNPHVRPFPSAHSREFPLMRHACTPPANSSSPCECNDSRQKAANVRLGLRVILRRSELRCEWKSLVDLHGLSGVVAAGPHG